MPTINPEATPLFSVIIPVYNGSNYMKEAIDSALNQGYENVEVIVVNDGSTDNGQTEEIALSYGSRIRYFSKPNGGVSIALNFGISKMLGTYFCWLSHDDIFGGDRIMDDWQVLSANPSAKVIFCRSAVIDPRGNVKGINQYPITEIKSPYDAMVLGGVNLCCMTIHRSCLQLPDPFNTENKTTQDVEFSIFLARKYEFFYNPRSVVFIRKHPQQGTRTQKKQHAVDTLALSRKIQNTMGVDDFFPGLDKSDHHAQYLAWSKLGRVYGNCFRDYTYSLACYAKACTHEKRFFSVANLICLLGPRFYKEPFVRFPLFILRFLKKMFQR